MRHSNSAGSRRMCRMAGMLVVAAAVAAPAAWAQGGTANTNDPRVGLKGGYQDAASAISNMVLLSHSPKPMAFDSAGPGGLTFANSDMAFYSHYVVQGNFSGFQIWDIANPEKPVLREVYTCATDQGDPSVYGHLLFLSAESTRNRKDCGTEGVTDTVSSERSRGVRIFDISDPAHPKHIVDVQTCRGSHTHTVVPDPKDKSHIYIYVSGSAGVRSPNELAGCADAAPTDNPNGERFRIEVIEVPLAHPEKSHVVSKPAILADLDVAPKNVARNSVDSIQRAEAAAAAAARGAGRGGRGGAGGRGGRGGRGFAPRVPTGPVQCHDITVYPAIGLAGGACAGYGLLLNIKDPANPVRIQAVADSNFSFWHSATFSNDGSKLIFTDEWGGGTQPKCRATDPLDWGGDAIFDLKNDHLTQKAYFKMPAAQTSNENCVAHNGSLVPVPGRDIMVQGWYQGGIDVFDFSDVNHPVEIAYFDRGPIDSTKLVTGGYWLGYWYNGHIYGSEIARGMDVFDLKPSPMLSANEIAAAKLVHFAQFNPQSQPKIVWPAAFPVVRSYLDQLVRDQGLTADQTTALATSIDAAERMKGAGRRAALTKVAASLDADVANAADAPRVREMAAAVRNLARASK